MTDDRVRELLDSDNYAGIVGAALNAAFGDEVCECDEPILSGDRLMCGRCLLENQDQRAKREATKKGPHPFAHGPERKRLELCRLCAGWPDDPRHEGQGEEMWGVA